MRADSIVVAANVLRTRHPEADSLLLSGSVVRGEATATSDLDLVALYPKLERSFRESFVQHGWPVEIFVHDEETIEWYFIEKDRASGVGSILWMVHDGVPVPGRTVLNDRIKARAQRLLDEGPPRWSRSEVDYSRYTITGLLDDLARPRNMAEQRAIVAVLHHMLGNHYLRSTGRWGAAGKMLHRRLVNADAALARQIENAFARAFGGELKTLFATADDILAPSGGRLFDGYTAYSEPDQRRNPPNA